MSMGALNFVVFSLLLSACSTTIIPPPAPKEPVSVAVLDHGRHSSLVIQSGPESMVRYSYGDWKFYALADTGFFQGSVALFWPSRAGLGRRELQGDISRDSLLRQVKIHSEEVLFFLVEKERADALRKNLDDLFTERLSTMHFNKAYDMEFVHHPKSYWALRNSNQMVGAWLESLGCEVEGPAIFSRWIIR